MFDGSLGDEQLKAGEAEFAGESVVVGYTAQLAGHEREFSWGKGWMKELGDTIILAGFVNLGRVG